VVLGSGIRRVFGGACFILEKLTGPGTVFIQAGGDERNPLDAITGIFDSKD